jgi:hypothetical protein
MAKDTRRQTTVFRNAAPRWVIFSIAHRTNRHSKQKVALHDTPTLRSRAVAQSTGVMSIRRKAKPLAEEPLQMVTVNLHPLQRRPFKFINANSLKINCEELRKGFDRDTLCSGASNTTVGEQKRCDIDVVWYDDSTSFNKA